MTLHIQMSPDADRDRRRKNRKNKLAAIATCLAFVAVGGATLYFSYTLIQGNEPPAIVGYEPPPVDKAPTETPEVKEESSRVPAKAPNPELPIIVTTAPSPIGSFNDIPAPEFRIGEGLPLGIGNGLDPVDIVDIGDGGGGVGNEKAGGSSLVGTFYDLKLTKNGAPTGITPSDIAKISCIYADFFKRGWRERDLEKYYRSPQQLYASNFFLPVCHPQYAPIAFRCSDKVKPSAWAVIYRGSVRAPKSGTFRFIGAGDDVLAVRFNRKTVLETGYVIPSDGGMGNSAQYRKNVLAGKYPDKKDYEYIKIKGALTWNSDTELGGFTAGNPFKVKEGEIYDIEIFISEIPGGKFGFVLLIDDVEDDKEIFDIFRTNFSEPDKGDLTNELQKHNALIQGMEWPRFNSLAPIWTTAP